VTHPLGVLVPEVGVLSETFVQWDCNQLLPGRTVVVADPPPAGETVLDGPSWTADGPVLHLAPEAGDPPPSIGQQAAVERFLQTHGVRVLLVQYLDLADRWFDLLQRLPVPVWVRGHGADLSARLDTRYSRLAALAGVMVPTHAARDRLVPHLLPQHLVHVVANHVAIPDPAPPRPAGATVECLTVGRLVPKKGHAGLLHAFAAAHTRDPRLRLDIIGEGPLRTTLEALVAGLDLAHNVRLLGARPPRETLARTARADIYLQPSVTGPDGDDEGQPLALLQAMAAARACIVTRHAGVTETLTDQQSALLVDGDAAAPLTAAITALAADPTARHRLGLAARHVAVNHHSHTAAREQLLHMLKPEAAP